jgi:hypothetical protein
MTRALAAGRSFVMNVVNVVHPRSYTEATTVDEKKDGMFLERPSPGFHAT